MKYFIGFALGVLTTTLFFFWFMRNPTTENGLQITDIQTNTDFEAFYEKFHSDSVFQMEHIIFPLDGLPANADSATFAGGDFRWERRNWRMHKKFDLSGGEYLLERSELGEGMIIEQIKDRNGHFGMQRRFAKMGEDWFLIYYAGMNRLAPE